MKGRKKREVGDYCEDFGFKSSKDENSINQDVEIGSRIHFIQDIRIFVVVRLCLSRGIK